MAGEAGRASSSSSWPWRSSRVNGWPSSLNTDEARARTRLRRIAPSLAATRQVELLSLERESVRLSAAKASALANGAEAQHLAELDKASAILSVNIDSVRKRAARLRHAGAREEVLRDLLRRARVVYDDGMRVKLCAPMAEMQRSFEEVVCSPRAIEARVFSSWIRCVKRTASSVRQPESPIASASGVSADADDEWLDALAISASYLSPSERRYSNTSNSAPCKERIRLGDEPYDREQDQLFEGMSGDELHVRSMRSPSFAEQFGHIHSQSPPLLSLTAPSCTDTPDLSPVSILDFVSYFVGVVCKAYHFDGSTTPASWHAALQQFSSRLIFFAVFPILFATIRRHNAAQDATFRQQQQWMRALPDYAIIAEHSDLKESGHVARQEGQRGDMFATDEDETRSNLSDLASAMSTSCCRQGHRTSISSGTSRLSAEGVSSNPLLHYNSNVDASFALAVSALSELSFAAVPVDALLCLFRAVKYLHESAARVMQTDEAKIGADVLQPFLVLAVVRPEHFRLA